MRPLVSVCLLYHSDTLAESLYRYLRDPAPEARAQYELTRFQAPAALLDFITQQANQVDCLVLQHPEAQKVLEQLQQQLKFFPTVILQAAEVASADRALATQAFYHPATLELPVEQLSQIGSVIDRAIGKFIQLAPTSQTADTATPKITLIEPLPAHRSLMEQQLRLAEKLKERLGYLGVYYKRNPQHFLRHLPPPQQEDLLRQLQRDYRDIILTYFSDETHLNQRIDNFVDIAFFADVSVSQIVEIHMELMDEFSKQLKLEGRSDEILQDYRLTLIDTIAHLCEMYRRSIPRES